MATARGVYSLEPTVLRDEIYQSNVFLQAKKNFDLLGMRLFLIAVSGLNPHFSTRDKYYDEKFKMVFVPTAKLTDLLGSSKYLGMLQKACVKLELVDIRLTDDGSSDSKLLNIFQHVDYRSHDGLYVCFNEKMRPYLLDLLYAKKGYTKLNVNYLLKLSSLYAIRLLEILLQFQNIPHYKRMMEIERKLTIKQLRFMLNVPEGAYKGRIDNFRKHVLDIPIKEINDNTPYFLRYKPIKKGTKTVGFKFTMATHNVPYKIAGKKPQFSNDAIDQLRAFGFDDGSARAIYNCCKGVDDCLLRLRRATALLYGQAKNVRNRLGFLRRAIEQDWHSSSMIEKEDPYSKPGWSAKIDYRSRRPGVSLRGPNKQVDRPPNYLPSDKMDKKLANAITQGEFYTPAPDNDPEKTLSKNDLTAESTAQDGYSFMIDSNPINISPKNSLIDEDTGQDEYFFAAEQEDMPSENDTHRQSSSVTTADNEPTSSIEDVPPPKTLRGDPYYEKSAAKLDKLREKFLEGPEAYERALEQDFEEEMRELAEKKARERAEFEKKKRERMQAAGINTTSSDTDSGDWTLLGNAVNSYINTHFTPEQLADFKMRQAKMRAKKEAKESGSLQTDPPKNEQATEPTTTDESAPQPKLSKIEIALAGITKLTKLYSKIDISSRITEEDLERDYQDGLKVFNEKTARERGLDENGKIKPPIIPPLPKRNINLPLPPPPPPEFERTSYRRTKKEKLIQKGIKELIQLYQEANALNEEPASILARTNDGVEAFKTEYDMSNGIDYVYLNDGTRFALCGLIDVLKGREDVWKWRNMLESCEEFFKMTPVETMRKFVKTFGTLPATRVLTPEREAQERKHYRNVYTGEWDSAD